MSYNRSQQQQPASKKLDSIGIQPSDSTDSDEQNSSGTYLPDVTDGQEPADYDWLESSFHDETPADRLIIWERKLLDFTMRNNLLNLRLTRKVIPFVSFGIDHWEDHLQAGESFVVMPSPLKKPIEPDEGVVYNSHLHKKELAPLVAEGLKQHQLYSYLPEDDLLTALKTLYRDSRTAMEENGADTLFLTLGLLRWYETERSPQPHFAPLLLLPVRMVRKSGHNYVIRMRGEDITFNTTLTQMLRQQFDIVLTGLSPLPKDQSGVDVRQIMTLVRSQLKGMGRWDIVEESMLGLFSFSKFVMWNDIHSNADLMRQNPIVEGLLNKQLTMHAAPQEATDMREQDHLLRPYDLALPVDVDSSQLEAVVESSKGRSFILYGPPGTGKSQTITNIIANAIYHGKRVLFVAEKMAALQVVQARLEKVGLGPFCLEMHANKMTKSHLLGQLATVLEQAHRVSPANYVESGDQLFNRRQELNTYVEHLHQRHATGLSLYDCIMRYEAIKDAAPSDDDVPSLTLSNDFLARVTDQQLTTQCGQLEQLHTLFSIMGHPADHPLRGLIVTDPSQAARQQLFPLLSRLSQLATDVMRLTGSQRLRISDVSKWQHLTEMEEHLLSTYSFMALQLDERQLLTEWQAINAKWVLPRFFARRSFLRRMTVYRQNFSEAEIIPLAEVLHSYHEAVSTLGYATGNIPLPSELRQSCHQLSDVLHQLASLCTFDLGDDPLLTDLSEKAVQWAKCDSGETVRHWVLWCQQLTAFRQQGYDFIITFMLDHRLQGSTMAWLLQRDTYRQLPLDIIDADPSLNVFNGLMFDQVVAKYREQTAHFQTITKQKLFAEMMKRVPRTASQALDNPELTLLKRWIGSNGRGMSIRRIMEQLPTLLPQLCPCMLMSPISVAQYIDLNNDKFDLVIFDEASQMPTSQAVGAIARGRNLIVVGDPRQMPPTNFFNVNAVDEQDAENDDMESILDDCITLSLPEHYLSWHYRSRHESLIAFSNAQYYDGRLYTFPSVDDRVSKVTFVPVNGGYDYRRSRSNREEACAIVDEVLRRLADDTLSQLSIGIVAFSKVQQNLIEDVLLDALTGKPDLEERAYGGAEPIFVKNLENVQGDERDVILFSVGYGPNKEGKVSMNFGPLNNQGGERRLNVAVSRARCEMMVFSTLQPEQIDLSRTKSRGVEGLKRFLEFAKNGRMADEPSASPKVEASTHRQVCGDVIATTPVDTMVLALADDLRKLGYQVDVKVGRSQFKVDLAIVDPANPERYCLGLLCDGTGYYATQTARDREVVQPAVLKGLDWKVMRVWTLDWFMNRDAVVQRIVQNIKKSHKK